MKQEEEDEEEENDEEEDEEEENDEDEGGGRWRKFWRGNLSDKVYIYTEEENNAI